MNLTSKSMLQFMTVCAGACALTATATSWVSDTFEAPEGTNQNLIAEYKKTVSGSNNETTNFLWQSVAGDASKLVPGAAADSGYAGIHPITNAFQALVLKLETEGQTLQRTVGTPVDFSGSSVYVDTLIQFTPSEDTPAIDSSVKVAVYVNVNSNLVVHHRWATEDWSTLGATNSVFAGIINPTNWHRLSIELKYQAALALPACRVYLDGQALTNQFSYSEAGVRGAGEWFINANANDDQFLSAIAFQGTGAVDELSVSDIVPDFGGSTGIYLTLVFDTAKIVVTTNGAAVADGGQLLTDTAIVINAKPWYCITNTGALFTGGATTNYVGTMITNVYGTVVAATAGLTNEIFAALYSETNALSTGLGNYPADKVASWASGHGLNPGDLTTGMLDDYLLNVAPATDAQIKITSIVYDAVNSKAVITVGASLPAVNFTNLNGTLVVSTTDDLATSFSVIGTFTITLSTASEVTIDVPVGQGTFIKAVVQ